METYSAVYLACAGEVFSGLLFDVIEEEIEKLVSENTHGTLHSYFKCGSYLTPNWLPCDCLRPSCNTSSSGLLEVYEVGEKCVVNILPR